eukprot:6197556-Pleurochrysis_carterae.AAC.2
MFFKNSLNRMCRRHPNAIEADGLYLQGTLLYHSPQKTLLSHPAVKGIPYILIQGCDLLEKISRWNNDVGWFKVAVDHNRWMVVGALTNAPWPFQDHCKYFDSAREALVFSRKYLNMSNLCLSQTVSMIRTAYPHVFSV